jgi:hypothetical protein
VTGREREFMNFEKFSFSMSDIIKGFLLAQESAKKNKQLMV